VIDLLGSLSTLPSRNPRSDDEAISMQNAYLEVLTGIDFEVLKKVCRSYRFGEFIEPHEKTQFFPSPAEIAHQCRKVDAALRSDLARERAIKDQIRGDAPKSNEIPQSRKDELLAKWKAVRETLDSGEKKKHERTPEESRNWLIAQIGQDEFDKIPDAGTGYFQKLK